MLEKTKTMAAKLDLSSPGRFKVSGEHTNLNKAWEQYLKRFEYYIKAANITKDEQKRALLLHISGYEVQDIFETFEDQGISYDDAVEKLSAYFEPKKNVAYERHLFHKAKQSADETIDNYIVRLSKLAVSCDFTDKHEMVRDQVVNSCYSTKLRKKLLEEEKLTLEKVQSISRTHELSETHSKRMEIPDENTANAGANNDEVNRVRHTKSGRNRNQGARPKDYNRSTRPMGQRFKPQDRRPQGDTTAICYRCGEKGHYGKSCEKTKDVTCYACGGKRHFAKMCRSKGKIVHVLSENSESAEHEREELFVLEGKNDATLSLSVEGKLIDILIDSGASTNVIDKSTYEQVKTTENYLSKSQAKIYPYGSKIPLELLGKTKLKVQIGSSYHEIDFQVVKGSGKPLIGRKTATELGLLRIGVSNDCLSLEQSNISYGNTDTIIRSFQDRFKGTGCLKDFELDLQIDKSVTPVAQPLRQIPFKMKKQVEDKIDELERNDIIEKVTGPTPWVSNVVPVPKQNNSVRLAVDMRQANKAIMRERFPMPNIDSTLQQMNGASIFSRLDLVEAFHQVTLSPQTRYITTFVCHKGLYRYKRLNYGISSASEQFQRILQQILQDIPNCKNIVDDIIIYADNQEDHDKVLRMVLTRLREKNLTLNKNKCEFNKSELKFMGHILSKNGIQIDEAKVKAVRDAEPTKSANEVLSFLGLVTFCAKFIKNYATTAEPLRKLTRGNVPWEWGPEQQTAFETLKQRLISAEVMAYYNPSAETHLIVDASPCGVAAILNQKQSNGDVRPVAYASRTLTPTERRYSQTEREALAVLFGIQRFHIYLYGMQNFTVYSDHKALERIFTSAHQAPTRIQNFVLKLQPYSFTVKFLKGSENISDILSRTPIHETNNETCDLTEKYVNYVMESSLPIALTLEEVQKECEADDTLAKVRKCIQGNRWGKSEILRPYRQIKNELTVKGSVILKSNKIIIPKSLQRRVLELAHESHQGIVKTKQLLREKVWWPNIDNDVMNKVKTCHACQVTSVPPREPPVVMTKLPEGPWQQLGMDLTGPFENKYYILAVIDYYSRFPLVEIITSITSQTMISHLRKWFSILGYPLEIRTDNAQNMVSAEMELFFKENGIKHSYSMPFFPRQNGEIERFNRSLKKCIQSAIAENKNWRTELQTFLLHYRATTHSTTNVSPAEALLNRPIRTKLPEVQQFKVPSKLKAQDKKQKEKI
ncbi:MAG: RNase H-like domain-containing protein, partial [Candidatus Thiodiazotropha taylori]|nr:DDE-type integrase/transposase/recombinase [Candidatus Thiodiazotropha taylori]MCW4286081.1 RNase H-like domain-containing protein [Candidatus Thiodiazotropha taylori]